MNIRNPTGRFRFLGDKVNRRLFSIDLRCGGFITFGMFSSRPAKLPGDSFGKETEWLEGSLRFRRRLG